MHQGVKKEIRIAAMEFLTEDDQAYIEFRLRPSTNGYNLTQQVQPGRSFTEAEGVVTLLSSQLTLGDGFLKVLDQLRSSELNHGLYQVLSKKKLPLKLYSEVVDRWVDCVLRLDMNFFSIHGNYAKYAKKQSAETKAKYLEIYQMLKNNWQHPPINTLWIEELVKREISEYNENLFQNGIGEILPVGDFLKKYYSDFENQIDRYLLHLGEEERIVLVTTKNRLSVQEQFEYHLHEKHEAGL